MPPRPRGRARCSARWSRPSPARKSWAPPLLPSRHAASSSRRRWLRRVASAPAACCTRSNRQNTVVHLSTCIHIAHAYNYVGAVTALDAESWGFETPVCGGKRRFSRCPAPRRSPACRLQQQSGRRAGQHGRHRGDERPHGAERPQRPERLQRPQRPERQERLERHERPQHRERVQHVERPRLGERVQRRTASTRRTGSTRRTA